MLLDVGGVFHLPDHDMIRAALARAESEVDVDVLDLAHYQGATAFGTDYEGDLPWREFWPQYVERYARACGVPDDRFADAIDHLDTTFTTMAPWSRVVPGAKEGLRELAATGLRLGVVSNADGTTAERLAREEVLQVGPGAGVEVETLIDSGVVGVSKPDPRIFALALDALGLDAADVIYVGDTPAIDVVGARRAGIHPVVVDPYGLHVDADYDRVASLSELASRLTGSA